MGTSLAPAFANLYLASLELPILEELADEVLYYKR